MPFLPPNQQRQSTEGTLQILKRQLQFVDHTDQYCWCNIAVSQVKHLAQPRTINNLHIAYHKQSVATECNHIQAF